MGGAWTWRVREEDGKRDGLMGEGGSGCFVLVKLTVKINVELACAAAVLVALFVELTSGFTVRFSHQIVLALATKTQSLSGTSVVSIPGLSSTVLM